MKKMICFALALVLLLTGFACARDTSPTAKSYSKVLFAMDTDMQLTLFCASDDGEAALAAAAARIQQIEAEYSATRKGSVIYGLNHGTISLEDLTQDQQELIRLIMELSASTGKAFYPRMYALTELWGFPGKDYHVPDQAEINEAKEHLLWDFGAVMKGYAGQEAADILLTDGAYGILSLGGNIQTFGSKPGGQPWRIGIQNPRGDGSIGVLSVEGTMSIVTSGDYQRYFEMDGVRYHHIMDYETGCPADSGVASVTIICNDGTKADAFSTAMFVLGLEKGSDFYRSRNDFEAVFVLTDGSVYATEGAVLAGCEFEVITREK